jgi:hypothetical protein
MLPGKRDIPAGYIRVSEDVDGDERVHETNVATVCGSPGHTTALRRDASRNQSALSLGVRCRVSKST